MVHEKKKEWFTQWKKPWCAKPCNDTNITHVEQHFLSPKLCGGGFEKDDGDHIIVLCLPLYGACGSSRPHS